MCAYDKETGFSYLQPVGTPNYDDNEITLEYKNICSQQVCLIF